MYCTITGIFKVVMVAGGIGKGGPRLNDENGGSEKEEKEEEGCLPENEPNVSDSLEDKGHGTYIRALT